MVEQVQQSRLKSYTVQYVKVKKLQVDKRGRINFIYLFLKKQSWTMSSVNQVDVPISILFLAV